MSGRPRLSMARERRAHLAVLALVAAFAAGCGSSHSSSTPGGAISTSQDRTTAQDRFTAYAACLRTHGIPNVQVLPGPQSGIRITAPQGETPPSRSLIDAADRACHKILKPQEHETDAAEEARFRDGMLAFARCLRRHGIDVADPTIRRVAGGFDVSFPPLPGGQQLQSSPRWAAASAACNHLNPLLQSPS
jgi:hypothetical protein